MSELLLMMILFIVGEPPSFYVHQLISAQFFVLQNIPTNPYICIPAQEDMSDGNEALIVINRRVDSSHEARVTQSSTYKLRHMECGHFDVTGYSTKSWDIPMHVALTYNSFLSALGSGVPYV